MKIILFDIDQTMLICPDGTDGRASEVMFKKVFNLDASENLVNNVGKTERCIIDEVLRLVKGFDSKQEVEIPNEAFKVWGETQKRLLMKTPAKVLPGIKELLTTLSGDPNIILGILTGNCRFRSDSKLSSAGIKEFFVDEAGLIRGAFGDVSLKRSDLIEEAKFKLGEGIYIIIDDSIVAGKMIKENNLPAILVATGRASEEELRQYSKYVFKDFGENRWQEVIEIIKLF